MSDTHDSNAPKGGEPQDSAPADDAAPFTQYDSRDEVSDPDMEAVEAPEDALIAAPQPTKLDTASGTRDDSKTRDDNTRDDDGAAAAEESEPPLFSDVDWDALNDSGVAETLASGNEVLESIGDQESAGTIERYEAEDYSEADTVDPVADAIAEASASLENSGVEVVPEDAIATEDIAYEEDETEEAAGHLIGHVEEVKALLPREKHPERSPIQLVDEEVDREDIDSPDRALDRGSSGRTTLSIDFGDFERQRHEELSTQDREVAAVEAAFDDLFGESEDGAPPVQDPVMAAEAASLLNLESPTVDKTGVSQDTGTGTGSRDVPVVGDSSGGSADGEAIYAGATEDHSKQNDPNRGMTVADASRSGSQHGSRSGSRSGSQHGSDSNFGDGRRSSSLVNMAQDSKSSKGTSLTGTRRLSGSFRLGDSSQFAGYTLLERIAEGGMGVVFKARQEGLNRIVAVKIMKGGALASAYRRRRFVAEAESAAALKHPHIVPIHEIGEENGNPYYIMDFVEGTPIHTTVREKKLEPETIARVMSLCSDAVQHFHSRGIIHRDLKPDNILVDQSNEPKVIDFGIAKNLMQGEERNMTREGAVLGTPHYMSPEQAKGSHKEVDTRTDVYALGAILYELLTGRLPFQDVDPKILLYTIIDQDPPAPKSVNDSIPWELSAIVMKAMEKDVNRRYQTAMELKQDIDRYLHQEPIIAQPATVMYRAGKFIRRRKAAVAAAASFLIVLVTLLSYIVNERFKTARLEVAALEKQAENDRKLAEAARANEDALKNAAEESKRAEIEAKKAKEAAERAAEQAKKAAALEKETARLQKEAKEAAEKVEAENRKRLIKQAIEKAKEPTDTQLQRVNQLTEALITLGDLDPAVRADIEKTKLKEVLELAQKAVEDSQTDFAAFWLDQANSLNIVKDKLVDVSALTDIDVELQRLKSGNQELFNVENAIARNDLLTARKLLATAIAKQAPGQQVKQITETLDAKCKIEAERLVLQGQGDLTRAKFVEAFEKGKQAENLLPGFEDAAGLKKEAAERHAAVVREKAIARSLRKEARDEALRIFDSGIALLDGTAQAPILSRERDQLARLIQDPALQDYRYVPAVPALKTKAAYVKVHEVTLAEYRQFIDARGYLLEEFWDEDFSLANRNKARALWNARTLGPDARKRPVTGISWYEARAYARWLSARENATYRLPSITEWQVAAGWELGKSSLRTYPWGDNFSAGALAFDLDTPSIVGTNRADISPFGLYDMGGNVAEWVTSDDRRTAAVKGADYFGSKAHGQTFSLVRKVSEPEAQPSEEVAIRIGFRLLREPIENN